MSPYFGPGFASAGTSGAVGSRRPPNRFAVGIKISGRTMEATKHERKRHGTREILVGDEDGGG